jgi:hypothetical protein
MRQVFYNTAFKRRHERTAARPRHKWKNNSNINLKKYDVVMWTGFTLAQDTIQWWPLAKAAKGMS